MRPFTETESKTFLQQLSVQLHYTFYIYFKNVSLWSPFSFCVCNTLIYLIHYCSLKIRCYNQQVQNHFPLCCKTEDFHQRKRSPSTASDAAPSNEKTISVHSIMVSVKAQIHLGISSRREMDVRKQKVSEVLTRGTKYAALHR